MSAAAINSRAVVISPPQQWRPVCLTTHLGDSYQLLLVAALMPHDTHTPVVPVGSDPSSTQGR